MRLSSIPIGQQHRRVGKVKNQYFADVNDYRKYGLLRQLAGSGLNIGVCWMLTESDGRNDGRFTRYCTEPAKWRAFDAELYDRLTPCAGDPGLRHVGSAKKRCLIPGAAYHEAPLNDDAGGRSSYFADAFQALAGSDLLFFDPDNGLEVDSVTVGNRKSSKYLYWSEVESAFGHGKSVLIYQHFPRQKRHPYIQRRGQELAVHTRAARVFALKTPFVLFLLAAQAKHLSVAKRAVGAAIDRWADQILDVSGLLPNKRLQPSAPRGNVGRRG